MSKIVVYDEFQIVVYDLVVSTVFLLLQIWERFLVGVRGWVDGWCKVIFISNPLQLRLS